MRCGALSVSRMPRQIWEACLAFVEHVSKVTSSKDISVQSGRSCHRSVGGSRHWSICSPRTCATPIIIDRRPFRMPAVTTVLPLSLAPLLVFLSMSLSLPVHRRNGGCELGYARLLVFVSPAVAAVGRSSLVTGARTSHTHVLASWFGSFCSLGERPAEPIKASKRESN